jgi:hypothetical protein
LTPPAQLAIIAKPLRNTANTNPVSFGLAEKIVLRGTNQRRARKQPPRSNPVVAREAFRPALQTPVFMCPRRPSSFFMVLDTAGAI